MACYLTAQATNADLLSTGPFGTNSEFVSRCQHFSLRKIHLKLCLLNICHIDHDDVIKWKYFPRYWPFVRGIHRSPVNSPHKGQWRGPLMFCFFICVWMNDWINYREAGDLRRYRAHSDVIVMINNRLYLTWLASLRADELKSFYPIEAWKIAHTLQKIDSNAISFMNIVVFSIGFHWSRFVKPLM